MSDLSPAQQMMAALREKYLTQAVPGRLDTIEGLILSLTDGENPDPDAAAALYREIHSLKGSAGSYGAMIVTSVCHQFEDYLDVVGSPPLTPEQNDVALQYVAIARAALAQVLAGEKSFPGIEQELQELRQTAFPTPRTALVVIASRSIAKIVLSTLAGLPLHIVVVQDGVTALQRLLHQRFDLLVTSLQVPELPGAALIGAVRLAEGLNRDISTIVVTSKADTVFPAIAQPDLVLGIDASLMQLGVKVSALLEL